MLAVLQPLHGKMEKGAETLKEISFNHVSLIIRSMSCHFVLVILFDAVGCCCCFVLKLDKWLYILLLKFCMYMILLVAIYMS